MKWDTVLLWLLAALLLAAMALTIIFAPNRSRHGYGLLDPPATPSVMVISSLS